MRRVVTLCAVTIITTLAPLSAWHAHAEGGADPVYAHLTTAQKHTYNQLYYGESDAENCYGTGRDGYNAYLTWINGTGILTDAQRGLADMQRLCSYEGNTIAKLTKDPMYKTSGLYHDFVMDGLLIASYENTLSYDINLALNYDSHNSTLQSDITAAALKARGAALALIAQRRQFRVHYGF